MRILVFVVIAFCSRAATESHGQLMTDEPGPGETRTEWKAPEATPDDYAEIGRYWREQAKKLDRLDVDLKFMAGREAPVPRGEKNPEARRVDAAAPGPTTPDARRNAAERAKDPNVGGSIKALVLKPDGTIVVLFRGRP